MMKRERYIIATLRKLWLWSEERKAALKKAMILKNKVLDVTHPATTKAVSQRKPIGGYVCAKCKRVVEVSVKGKPKQYVVDHITPVIDPEKGFENWDKYFKRMFCPAKGLQVLCKGCHDNKHKNDKKRKG